MAAHSSDQESTSTIIRAACPHDCPDACAMLVHVDNGRAMKVAGDPSHPFTRGGLCVKVNNYTDRVYDPGRVLFPMRRNGPKGSGSFQRVSWDEALTEVAEKFTAIAEKYGPEALLPIHSAGSIGALNGLNAGDPFCARFGASVAELTYCSSGSSTAYVMTNGPTAGVDPESIVHSRFILLWGNNVISTNLHLWPFVKEAQKRGAKVVVIDPIRTRTAAAADQHIAIRPGTDGALALAIGHVVITEELTDDDYIERHTVGFSELRSRLNQYTPEWAEQETGVEANTIRALAREYATMQPSLIRIGIAVERHTGGGQAIRMLSCLPALVGAWRKPGGGILQMTLWAFPVNWDSLLRADLRSPGTRVVNQFELGKALTGELTLDPPVKALLVYNTNPVVVCPEQDKIVKGLLRDDLFTVVSEQFMTDTAQYADIIFPATTQLEQEDIMFSWGHFYVAYNKRSITPLGEAVPNTEFFRRLAARMGYHDQVFRRTDEEMIADAFDWSHPSMAGITIDSLKENGWQRLNLPSADSYAPHAEGNFPTPSGKVELVSSLAQSGNFVLPVWRQGSNEHQPGQFVDPVPCYIPPQESSPADSNIEKEFPFSLLTPKSHAYLNSSYANLPFQRRAQRDPVLFINPSDATERGIVDGQDVRVFNDRGEFTVAARLDDSLPRGVVVCPVGNWRQHSPTLATQGAVNSSRFADLGNAPTFSDTAVDVRPAEGVA